MNPSAPPTVTMTGVAPTAAPSCAAPALPTIVPDALDATAILAASSELSSPFAPFSPVSPFAAAEGTSLPVTPTALPITADRLHLLCLRPRLQQQARGHYQFISHQDLNYLRPLPGKKQLHQRMHHQTSPLLVRQGFPSHKLALLTICAIFPIFTCCCSLWYFPACCTLWYFPAGHATDCCETAWRDTGSATKQRAAECDCCDCSSACNNKG
jgi:hypothetical protein